MRVSVVIPALNEELELPRTLEALALQNPARLAEVVVVDGGSTDRTRDLVVPPARLLAAPRGRARQLNAGAAACTGEALLFLHADCRLPGGALEAACAALSDPRVAGGGFHKRFESRRLLLRNVRWRTRAWRALFGAVLGDQAQFVRRKDFERLGGFREDVAAEDLDLSWRLRREGRLVLLPSEVSLSARRLEAQGILRTWARWWATGIREALRRAQRDADLSSERESARGSTES